MNRAHCPAKITGIDLHSTRIPRLLIQQGIMNDNQTHANQTETPENTTDLSSFLLNWCAGKQPCYEVLCRYFPPHTKLPMGLLFTHLLKDIMLSHEKLAIEAPLVIKVYGVVGALAIVINLCLLVLMLSLPYRSTTTVFLTIIVVLDLHEACALLVSLSHLHGQHNTYKHSDDTTSRKLHQFQDLFSSISCVLIMLLVAVDRWAVHNLTGGYLFRHHRKTKICCSLGLIVVLVAAVNYMLPLTVDIILNGETVQVFICITHSCHGSLLLQQKWRSYKDTRINIYLKCFQCCIALIFLVFGPINGCIWNALSKKAASEKQYEAERARSALCGQEIVYFNHIHVPKMKPQSDLPVIYEVDEEDENVVDKGVMFPYTLQIWHTASSLCSLTTHNTFLYDEHPVAENARPVTVQNFAVRKTYDTNVDRISVFRRSHKRVLPTRLAFKSKFPARRSYTDFNLNALSSTSAWAKPMARTGAVSRPLSAPAPIETCHHCLHMKHKRHKDTFSTRQIVFSINCCCNQGAPIDCHTEITYLNRGDYCETARTSSQSGTGDCAGNVETVEGGRNIISGRSQDMALVYDTNTACTIPESRFQMQCQEDTNDIELKLNQRHVCYHHHADWQSTSLPGGRLPSCCFPEDGSVLKPAIKPCTVTQQLHSTPRFTGTSNDPVEEHRNSLQQCDVCQKHTVQYECANASWNNNFLNRIKRAKLLLPAYKVKHRTPHPQYHGTELPLVDFKTAKSQSIMLVIDEHYTKHSHRLKPLGIPSTLSLNVVTQKTVRSKYIISRLIFLTGCYFVAFVIPCLIELTNVPYSTVLYMSSHLKMLMQFTSLLIFSHGFRHKLVKCFYRKK